VASQIKKVLVPVDSSEGACDAARLAVEMAKGTGASLHLLHVLDTDPDMLMGATALSREELQRARDQFAKLAFEAVGKVIDLETLKPTMEIRMGKASLEIVKYAKNENIDLIVMGSRGLSGIKEFLLGSVSSQVLHHAPCSVTVVR